MKRKIVVLFIIALTLGGCSKLVVNSNKSNDSNVAQEVQKVEGKENNTSVDNKTDKGNLTQNNNSINDSAQSMPKEESSKKDSISIVTEDQKALEIVKKDLGAKKIDNNTYSTKSYGNVIIRSESKDNKGIYRISVRNSKTTEIIKWYFVDVKAGTFEVEQ